MPIYEYEPFITDKQRNDFELLVKLSDSISLFIANEQSRLIELLLDKNITSSEKKNQLNRFVETRANFDNQVIVIDDDVFYYKDAYFLAKSLNEDATFYGNDSPYVINGLDIYTNTISLADLVISYHNYCLWHCDNQLKWLATLLSDYIYSVLTLDGRTPNYSIDCDDSYNILRNLANYVVDFWELNLKDMETAPAVAKDDKKRSIYDRIDHDAMHQFAIDDSKNKEEENKYNAIYAADLISQCSKSLFLLKSTIEEINDPKSFAPTLKRLRKAIVSICEDIYRNEEDYYRDLEIDERLVSSILRDAEKDYEVRILKIALHDAVEKLRGQDTERLLASRTNRFADISAWNSKELIDEFSNEFRNALVKSIPYFDLNLYKEKIKNEIGNRYELLPEESVKSLASAEYLFDTFVRKDASDGFDYSGVAALYFQSFEAAYNKLIIEPYSKWLLSQNVDSLYREKVELGKHGETNEREHYIDIKKKIRSYFSDHFNENLFFCKEKPVAFLEIGKFAHFINLGKLIRKRDVAPLEYESNNLVFSLENICFKKQIDSEKLDVFVDSITNANAPRNKACHGLHPLSVLEVKEDKAMIYENGIRDIRRYKILLYALIDFFS